jgi:RNA polymerase-interacting CarD/CdnL/TRCF family regulator
MLLDLGEVLRYRGLGAGRVIDHVERDFGGQPRVFAVIAFPHRDMTAQVPVGDPKLMGKLAPVRDEAELREMLEQISLGDVQLARTWDQREEHGVGVLRDGEPEQWAQLLAGYARSRALDYAVSASDQGLIGRAVEMLAAELAAASGARYEDERATVRTAYDEAVVAMRAVVAEREQVA